MFKLLPETFVILLFNIIPIFGVAFYNWSPFEVFWLFWMETLIIAVFNTVRVLYSQGEQPDVPYSNGSLKLNIGPAISYLVVRVIIFLFYSVFIITFIGIMANPKGDGVGSLAVIVFADKLFNLALLITIVSQAFYLIRYFFMNGAYRFSKRSDYTAIFDARQIVIHVAVVLGAVGASFLFKDGNPNSAIWIIAVFCVVKTVVELALASYSKKSMDSAARQAI